MTMKSVALAFVAAWAVGASAETRIERIDADIYRVRMTRDGRLPESLLNRYGIIEKGRPETVAALPTGLSLPEMKQTAKGFELRFPLAKGECIYGLGDVSRDNLNRRGGRYEIWVKNVNSYIPMPMTISSRGWGVLVNCVECNYFDIGKTDKDAMVVTAEVGEVDFYLFVGKDYRALLERYTWLTGRPKLLPIFAYGFAYVANQWVDSYETVQEAYKFRELDLPCDTFGLEPGWMEYFYDSTTKKDWNKRFEIADWQFRQGSFRRCSWLAAMERMGFKLSLWLCMKYDLFVYEEALADGKPRLGGKFVREKDISDQGFEDKKITENKFEGLEEVKTDDLTRLKAEVGNARRQMVRRPDGFEGDMQSGEEPWFKHLHRFVWHGARCFKMDGGWQVCEFPERTWAGKYTDAQVHNIYPLVYAKQMCEGYEDFTGRRAMCYSAGGYIGIQRYVATWAGDTGGGERTLVSTLNLGASGHPNQSCDMDLANLAAVHYGVFAPWSQQNNWDYFQQPWYQSPEGLVAFRNYIHLRYRLVPYIYSTAIEASRTGWPIARPLIFVYPDHPEYANVCTTYMFGDNLLVSAFADETVIPPGTWYEWHSGRKVVGPCREPVKVGDGWGGGLYVKAGAIIPMWPVLSHLEKGWHPHLQVHIWPSENGTFDLYEDDGDTLAFQKGAFTVTPLEIKNGELVVGPRRGGFKGMPSEPRKIEIIRHE